MVRTFQSEKAHIKGSLYSTKSKVHITCDLWTSPNSLAILGLVGHFIAENGELRHPVLALKELKEEHTGEHIAQLVLDVVQDYEIASKLGYFMMDNASNNDTIIVELSIRKYIYIKILKLVILLIRLVLHRILSILNPPAFDT